MSYCDTCGHKYSDICGTCVTLDGVPVQYTPRYSDPLPIKDDGIIGTFDYATGNFTPARKMTKVNIIRAMSDRELASFLAVKGCIDCKRECEEVHCESCWLEWLKQEAEE